MVAGERFERPMAKAYETLLVAGPYPRNYLSDQIKIVANVLSLRRPCLPYLDLLPLLSVSVRH